MERLQSTRPKCCSSVRPLPVQPMTWYTHTLKHTCTVLGSSDWLFELYATITDLPVETSVLLLLLQWYRACFGTSLQVVKGSVTPDSLAALRRKLITCYTNLVDGTQGAVATMEDAEVI